MTHLHVDQRTFRPGEGRVPAPARAAQPRACLIVATLVTEDAIQDENLFATRMCAHYYPGAQPMKIKLVVERGTGRLLGAQIVGGAGAGKRIDVLATALWNRMTVAEVAEMDLSYAPPFSPVWDPVLLAAGKAAAMV